MNNKSVVDIDEEGNFLIPGEIVEIHPLQLGGRSHVNLKLSALTDAIVVDSLQVDGGMMVANVALSGEEWCRPGTRHG